MKLFFAGTVKNDIFFQIAKKAGATNLLETYYGWESGRMNLNNYLKNFSGSFFLDSGAFTAFTMKKSIDIDKYIDFIKKNKKVLFVYAGLDVIEDWKATKKNMEYMEKAGLKPLPTFHTGSPFEELERMCKKYDYIALGGLVGGERQVLEKWLDKCWSVIKKHFPIRVHGFGLTAYWALDRYPFYSVDSTSWLTAGKFRRFSKFTNMKMNNLYSLQRQRKKDNTLRLDLQKKTYKDIGVMQIKEYKKMETFITRVWEARGVVWK